MPSSSALLTVDLDAIAHNLDLLTSTFGHLMVMVKANGYGTDSQILSKFIQKTVTKGIPYLGVSHVWEGIGLRESGIQLPIFVISTPPFEADLAARYELTPAVSNLDEIVALADAGKKYRRQIPLHLHLNTGMNRFGASMQEAFSLYEAIQNSPHLYLEGVLTHFVAAETASFDPITRTQIQQFKSFIDTLPILPRWIHAANSGGAVRFPLPFCNLVRIGLGVFGYGICLNGSRPTLKLTTKLASISRCQKGATVGYNCTYTFEKEEGRIGVVPVGYHDGIHRSLSNKGYLLVKGKRAPMIGTVCMDFMMIDLSDIPEAEIGDEITLFGDALSPEIVAQWGETDVREILVNIPERVHRQWNFNSPVKRNESNNEPTVTERLPTSLFSLEKDPTTR